MSNAEPLAPYWVEDVARGRRVLYTPARANRPHAFRTLDAKYEPLTVPECPFCPGNEAKTPPEIRAERDGSPADTIGWRWRMMPNKFPAVLPVDGIASHAVLVETPAHFGSWATMGLVDLANVLEEVVRWMSTAVARPGIEEAVMFKNHGANAGASIDHSHLQLVALTNVSAQTQRERESVAPRLPSVPVRDLDGWRTECPAASRFPWEAHIHVPEGSWQFTDWALQISYVLEAWEKMFGILPAHNATVMMRRGDARLSRMELFPRVSGIAGFELATGAWMNPITPERAARELREALGDKAN